MGNYVGVGFGASLVENTVCGSTKAFENLSHAESFR